MAVNIEQMIEDGVEEKLIFLASMASASQFEKIAMRLENPQIFQQFMALNEDAVVWDYAYAAGLISRADADLMNSYEIPADDDDDDDDDDNNKESSSEPSQEPSSEPSQEPGQ